MTADSRKRDAANNNAQGAAGNHGLSLREHALAPKKLANGVSGPIRSPLVGMPPPTTSSRPVTPQLPVPSAAAQDRLAGAAPGGDDLSARFSALRNMTYGVSDAYEKRRRRIWLAGFTLAMGGVIAMFQIRPEIADTALLKIAEVSVHIERLSQRPKRGERSHVSTRLNKSTVIKSPALPSLNGCQALLEADGVGRLPAASLAAAECLLVQDNIAGASAILTKHTNHILRMPESALNSSMANSAEASLLLLLVQTHLKAGRLTEVDRLLENRCTAWARTNTCVGKLLALAYRQLTTAAAAGFQRLAGSTGGLDHRAVAQLYWAAAATQNQQGHIKQADRYFDLALQALPPPAMALRKAIYEANALALYRRGDNAQLQRLTAEGLKALKTLGPGAVVKLNAMAELAQPGQTAAGIKVLLSREDIAYRARGDYEWLDILGLSALRQGQAVLFAKLVARSKAQFASYKASPAIMRQLGIWEIRALLAQRNFEQSLALIKAYDEEFQADQRSHHLHGIALLGKAGTSLQAAQAASEFKAALRGENQWETLYALGVALIRSGKPQAVAAIIKDLEGLCTTRGQRYWLDMLKSEWFIATGKTAQSKDLLGRWLAEKPDAFTPRWLLLLQHRQLGNTRAQRQLENQLDNMAQRRPYALSREAFSSPLGVMALAPRPLE